MKKQLTTLLLLLTLAVPSFAAEFKKTLNTIELLDNDTVVFLGDSITHQCLYTQYVEDYFYTRYPNRRVNFHNAGVGGDQAIDTLIRFDDDVAKFKPKYVTVLIGMNDGHYTGFEHEIFNTYKKNMTKLLDKITAINATAILMTPTMYDLRPALMEQNWVEPLRANNIHYNAVLAFFGAWVRQQANERGLGFANMYEPLNRITREQRKTDPEFTMIEDAVHPGPDGQLVMALALLKDINANPIVSTIDIVRKDNRWLTKADNGRLANVSTEKIGFTFTANSLPWLVPDEAALGYKITNAGHKMSRETIRVTSLTSGDYKLQIDGTTVGTYSHLQLSAGIELQENKNTPQYAQAMKVAMLNKRRNDEALRPMRDLWVELKVGHHLLAGSEELDDESEELLEEFDPKEFKEWEAKFPKKVAALLKKAKQLEDKIYQLNKPKPHEYKIVSAR